MNIYFQFLTQNQTAEAAEMIRLITVLTGYPKLAGRVKISAHGALSRSQFSDVESLSTRLASKAFNHLEIVVDPLPKRLPSAAGRITSISGVFSPSPTSALWLPTRAWKMDADRAARNRYMTAKTKEDVLTFHHVSKKPSVFELCLEVGSKMVPEAALDRCADELPRSLPESLRKLHLFGCCDVLEPVFIPQFKTSVLMPERVQVMMSVKPPAYPELGGRFEALHGLMFGSKRLCKGISLALGKEAKLIAAGDAADFAVVRLSPTCDKAAAGERAADWLITGADKLT